MCRNSSKSKEDFLGNELECDCLGCAIVSEKIKIPGLNHLLLLTLLLLWHFS